MLLSYKNIISYLNNNLYFSKPKFHQNTQTKNMSKKNKNYYFPFEQENIQTLIDEMENSSQIEQDDMNFPLFNFQSPNIPEISSSSNKTDNSTNSNSSGEEAFQPYPISCYSLTLQNVLNAMKIQKAAIYLQTIISEMKPNELSSLINQLKGNFCFLMKDKNGNYFCSDIFKLCTPLQRQCILQEIFNYVDVISIHEFGTHAIQTLIEYISTKEEANLLCSSLCDEMKMPKVALHPRGAYVIQKIINKIPEELRTNFNSYFLKVVPLLSVDIFGVCTVKQFVLYTKFEPTIIIFLNIIYKHFYVIAKNKYGNYLIQFLLEFWWNKNEMFAFKILIEKSFYEFSIDEFSSHIVEKYIKKLNLENKQRLYREVLQKGIFNILLNNRYGMFVVNKLINCLK